jgi:hypothetical protein
LLIYRGGNQPESPEAGQAVMQARMAWFDKLGQSVVDSGNPCGAAKTIASNGSVSEGGSGVGGYSVISAGSIAEATEKAKGCPHLQAGGPVEVYETIDPMQG